MIRTSTLELLHMQFHGQVRVSLADAARAIGRATQTLRNQLSTGTCPIPTHRDGGRRFVFLVDLAQYLDGLRSPAQGDRPRRRPGKPRKAEVVARRRAVRAAVAEGEL